MTTQAQNNINTCKGNPTHKILMLWDLGRINKSIITEIAEHYKIKDDKKVVAEYLSKL